MIYLYPATHVVAHLGSPIPHMEAVWCGLELMIIDGRLVALVRYNNLLQNEMGHTMLICFVICGWLTAAQQETQFLSLPGLVL